MEYLQDQSMNIVYKNILSMFNAKEIDNDWSFSNYKQSDTKKWTHCYHRYPAKFIPQLVEKLFAEYTKDNATINDPFYGSGTTIVSAIAKGFKATGTDINKIAYLITKVKSTPIEPNYLNKKLEQFLLKIKYIDSSQLTLSDVKPLIPEEHITRIDYWFTEGNKLKLGKILRIINNEEDEKIKDFLLVAFSHILKNCSIWLQKSTKPTRDLKKVPAEPYVELKKHLKRMEIGNKEFYKVVPKEVRENLDEYLNITIGDAKHQNVDDNSVDLIITSSPYVTSYEYADLHQLSTIWLSLVNNLSKYKKEFIGTYKKSYNNKKPKSTIATYIIDRLIKKDYSLAKAVEAFFVDMEDVFNESYRILKYGGRCCYVIGNTKLKGIDILNAEVFAESLVYTGFKLDRIIKRIIPSKILPQKRDEKTGRFASNNNASFEAYPSEYIVIGLKE